MPESENSKKKVAIIGLGLLGASMGMALRDKNYIRLGWTRNPAVREWAVKGDVLDHTSDDICEILAQADITVLCLPIPQIMNYIKNYATCWKPGSIVTDIGSVKEVIVKCGEECLQPRGVHFVGSHPMAGTEKAGPESAFSTLYANAEVFITTTANTDKTAYQQIVRLWEDMGTRTVTVGAKEHDILVAHTSHLSHVLALALTESVLDCPPEELEPRYSGCATGFRDTSRIASSSPQMWREIIEHNQPAVLEVVKEFEKRWHHLREIIQNQDYEQLEAEFCQGKELRDGWIKYKNTKHHCNW